MKDQLKMTTKHNYIRHKLMMYCHKKQQQHTVQLTILNAINHTPYQH